MNLRQAFSVEVTASAIAHVSVLALVLFFSDVRLFGGSTVEAVAVDIVTPQEVEKKPEPSPPPPTEHPAENTAGAAQPAPTRVETPIPQQQAAPSASPPARPQTTPNQAVPAYTPPEPDLSIKYHVLLGLPPDLPPSPAPRSGDKANDDFDAAATRAADITPSVIAEFRRQLRTCSKLPASLKASDVIKVTLRVFMTPQGRLADEPLLIEASASEKGPLLMRSAMSALEACQPYSMLPADRYGEWKVIDLSFTPQDFS
jgi:outer membrane biosynthesis protein TonB